MIIPNIWENKKCSKPPTSYSQSSAKKTCQIMPTSFFQDVDDDFSDHLQVFNIYPFAGCVQQKSSAHPRYHRWCFPQGALAEATPANNRHLAMENGVFKCIHPFMALLTGKISSDFSMGFWDTRLKDALRLSLGMAENWRSIAPLGWVGVESWGMKQDFTGMFVHTSDIAPLQAMNHIDVLSSAVLFAVCQKSKSQAIAMPMMVTHHRPPRSWKETRNQSVVFQYLGVPQNGWVTEKMLLIEWKN